MTRRRKSARDVFGITSAAATRGGAVWVTNDSGHVVRLGNGEAQRIRVGEIPLDVVATGDALWVAAHEDKAVNRVDTQKRRVVATIKLGYNPIAIVAGASFIAVAVEDSPF